MFLGYSTSTVARPRSGEQRLRNQLQSSLATDHSQIYRACKLDCISSSWKKGAVVKLLLVPSEDGMRDPDEPAASRRSLEGHTVTARA